MERANKAMKPGKLEQYTHAEQKIATERYDSLSRVWDYKARGHKQPEALAVAGLSRSKYHRWNKAYNELGVEGLIPDYRARRAGKIMMTPGQLAFMRDRLGQQNAPHVHTIYHEYYIPYCDSVGEKYVSYSTFKRAWEKTSKAYKAMYSKGPKYFDNSGPFSDRDLDVLGFLEMINSDHMQWDSKVRMPNGDIGFPWLTWWYDMGTNMPLGWEVTVQPNQDTINHTLYKTIDQYGLRMEEHEISVVAYVDHGRDYRSRQFMGMGHDSKVIKKKVRFEIDGAWIRGIYANLGIDVILASPYNPKTKPIEPAHSYLHNLERADCENFYRGTGPEHKPEYMQGAIMRGGQGIDPGQLPTLEEFTKRVEWYMYSFANHVVKRMGITPYQAAEQKILQSRYRRYSEEKLAILMAKLWKPTPLTVWANGIKISKKIKGKVLESWYRNDEIYKYEGEKVFVKYNPYKCPEDNLPDEIFVYNIQGQCLFTAYRSEKAHPYKAAKKVFSDLARRKGMRKTIVTSQKEADDALLDEIAAKEDIITNMYEMDMKDMASS